MTTRSSFLPALLLLLAPCPSQAEDCTKIHVSQQVFDCSVRAKLIADREMNVGYRQLLENITSTYGDDPLGVELKSAIKTSQRAWLRLRDYDCELEAFAAERGTQAYEATLNHCVARKSTERISYLKGIVEDL